MKARSASSHWRPCSSCHRGRYCSIGPNGAGKTTLVNLLTGVLAPSSGTITLGGEDITSLAAHRRVRRGLVRTFQISQLFDSLTPQTTLMLALTTEACDGARWWRPLVRNREIADEAQALLARFRLGDVQHQPTAQLPYGKRRLLEIAIALAQNRRCCCSTNPSPAFPKPSGATSSTRSPRFPKTSRFF